MSDHIPFEIEEEIMKKLPVKSLIQFRSVSKQWKSLIDSSKFIKKYHINRTHPQHHLLVQYIVNDDEQKYISIIDDNTFRNHKFSVTSHQLQDFYSQSIVGSSQGIICIFGSSEDIKDMDVLWNPTVRKSVRIIFPHLPADFISVVFSFGVCPNTNDPKLVQVIDSSNILTMKWEAKIFTLSTKVWKTITIPSALSNNHDLGYGYVSAQGFIYYLAHDTGIKSNLIVSFDLSSEEFGQVYLPDSLLHSRYLELSKRNECLTLLESNEDVDDIHVWMMNDSVTKSLTKMFTLKSLGLRGRVKC